MALYEVVSEIDSRVRESVEALGARNAALSFARKRAYVGQTGMRVRVFYHGGPERGTVFEVTLKWTCSAKAVRR